MALSGVFSTTIATGYRLQLEWSATQSTINNASTITTNLYWMSLGSSYTVNSSATKTGSTTIAEETFNFSGAGLASLSGNQKKLIHTAVKTISHNSNGYLDTTLSAVFNIAVTLGTYYASVSIPSSPITLDRILRLSYPTLSPNPITMGGDMVITSNRVSGDYLHKYYYSFGGITKTLISGGTNVNNFTWTTDLATLAGQVTGATSGTGTIYCETYSGATLLGESQTSFTAVVPANVVPTQTSITLTELTSGVQTILGNTDYFIQGISNIRATINGGAGVYGSTIDKYYHRLFGVEYENATNVYDSGVISGSGSQTISGRIRDTRGRYSVYSDTSTKTIIPYSVPVVNTFTVLRCTSNGTLDDLGEYVKIIRSGTATTLPVATVEKNRISAKVYYKIKGAGSWTEITTSTPSGIKVTESSDLANGVTTTSYVVGTGTTFAVTNVYEFKLEIIDKLNTTTSNIVTVPIGSTVMSWSDVGVGIGKVWQSGALDVKGVSNFEGNINQTGDMAITGNLIINGSNIVDDIPKQSYLVLVDISEFTITSQTALNTTYPQVLPLSKFFGSIPISSNILTLAKGYVYEFNFSFTATGTGRTNIATILHPSNSAFGGYNVVTSATATINISNCAGNSVRDLTDAVADVQVKIANIYKDTPAMSIEAGSYSMMYVKTYKKITI